MIYRAILDNKTPFQFGNNIVYDMLEWCIETFGENTFCADVDDIVQASKDNLNRWGWETENGYFEIRFSNNNDYMLFLFRWHDPSADINIV